MRPGPGAALGPVAEVLEAGLREGIAPGLSAAVVFRGRLVHGSVHGDAQIEPERVRLTPGHHFDVASLTKVMATTSLAAVMVDRGEIGLDEAAARWLPGFERHGKAAVTVRQLLAHRSGLVAWRPYFEEVKRDPVGHAAFLPAARRPRGGLGEPFRRGREMIRRAVLDERLESPPGTRTAYSDAGFMALGWALEGAGGGPLDRLCRERVFAPLALASTFFAGGGEEGEEVGAPASPTGGPEQRAFVATERCAHRLEVSCGAVDDANAWALGGVAGHAGLFSTAREVAALGQEWLEAWTGRGALFSRVTARAFAMPAAPGERALGWDRPTPGTTSLGSRLGRGPSGAIGHLGHTGCSLWIDLDAGLACALLTNHVHPDGADKEQMRVYRRRFHDAVAEALGIGP